MNDWPDNWDQCESEHNRHYDPYAEKCPECGAEDTLEEVVDEEDGMSIYIRCRMCGEVII